MAKRRSGREKRKMRLINADKLKEIIERDFCYPEALKRRWMHSQRLTI